MIETYTDELRWIKKAKELSNIFRGNAYEIDIQNRFPKENIRILKETGFMKLFIPKEYGGYGLNSFKLYEITRILAQGCMSTAIIWGMHFQQVEVLCSLSESIYVKEILKKICKNDYYIGSVTTEFVKGGTLLEAFSPIIYKNDEQILIHRKAPVVTGGNHCDSYLITMRKNQNANSKEVMLVYVNSNEIDVKKISSKTMLGLRGTYTIGVELNGIIGHESIINSNKKFKNIAVSCMIPVGHLVWVNSWLGTTEMAYKYVREQIFRNPKVNKNYLNDVLLNKLASIQSKIDLIRVYVENTSLDYHNNKGNIKYLFSNKFQLKINNVKITSSETLYDVINKLIEIVGLNYGFIKSKDTPLERILRDLRSSYLMFNNNRLKSVNSKLVLYEEL